VNIVELYDVEIGFLWYVAFSLISGLISDPISERRDNLKKLKCRDVGFDCDDVMRAETESEIMQQAAVHAKTVHNVSEISEQAVARIRTLILDEGLPAAGISAR
jgi:predicted small metal-binding protein